MKLMSFDDFVDFFARVCVSVFDDFCRFVVFEDYSTIFKTFDEC